MKSSSRKANIKLNMKETDCEDVDWTHIAHNRAWWRGGCSFSCEAWIKTNDNSMQQCIECGVCQFRLSHMIQS
jgi:hypothetical protein